MKSDLIIRNIRQLVTCASNGAAKRGREMQDVGMIENGAVAVVNGVIAGIGTSEEILHRFVSDQVIDAHQKVVTPGFVECHTHIVFAGDRINEFELRIKGASYMAIMEAGGGILSTVRQTRESSFEQLVEQSRRRLDKLLALGVTTCEVKTGYGLDTETELKMLRAIFELDMTHAVDLIPTFLPAHAVPPEFNEEPEKYADMVCEEMLPRAMHLIKSHSGNARCFADVFCEKNAFDLEQSRRVLITAKSLGFGLKAHVDEFTNLGGAKMAIGLGATSIDHLDVISDEEIELLAASGTVGVVTPTVNFNFGAARFADARKLVDAGCALAISTDFNPGSAPCASLPNAMAIACRYQGLMPSEALNSVTINAAAAIGSAGRIGTIEPGKAADLLIIDAGDYREISYEFGGNLIAKVFKNGEVVHENV